MATRKEDALTKLTPIQRLRFKIYGDHMIDLKEVAAIREKKDYSSEHAYYWTYFILHGGGEICLTGTSDLYITDWLAYLEHAGQLI